MTYMNVPVGVSKINPDPAKCVMLTTQQSVIVSGLGNYDIKTNGDITLQLRNLSGIDGTIIKFVLNDVGWQFVTGRPIVIALATGTEGCTPTAVNNFPPGIGYTTGTTPSARAVSVTLPKADFASPVEYHYWLQVMKPNDPGSAKWVHPKIRNDTVAFLPPRGHSIFRYFAEHPLIGFTAIAAAVLAAAALGFFLGHKS